jgi:hypothetical protein
LSSQLIDVKGKIKFIHAVNFNKYDKWSVTLTPDQPSLEIIRDLQAKGIKNVMKKDDDGYYIQFSREPTKLIRGKVVAFAAPKVFDDKGVLMDGSKVGRGSDATIRLEVYPHGTPNGGKSHAARWDSIRIDNLIVWDPDVDMPPSEAEEAKDLINSPKPVWA